MTRVCDFLTLAYRYFLTLFPFCLFFYMFHLVPFFLAFSNVFKPLITMTSTKSSLDSSSSPWNPKRPHSDDTLEFVASSLTSEDLCMIRVAFGIPSKFELELSGPQDWVCSPPPGQPAFYEEAFRTRLRFFLPPFIVSLFSAFGLPLVVVSPNSFRFIVGFIMIYILVKVQSTLPLFQIFLTFKHNPLFEGWWYATPLVSCRGGYLLHP